MSDLHRVSLALAEQPVAGVLGASIKQALADQGKGNWLGTSSAWLGNKALEAINETLVGVDLLTLLAEAWGAAAELTQYVDSNGEAAGKARYVKLGNHAVSLDLKPSLTISAGPWSSQPIELLIQLSTAVAAMELKMRDGHIVSLHGGECDVGFELSLFDEVVLKRQTLKTFKLDVEHQFEAPGIAMGFRNKASQLSS